MKLLLVGCGNLGSSLLKCWSKLEGLEIAVIDPHSTLLKHGNIIAIESRAQKLPQSFMPDAIVLAVKPQQIKEAITQVISLIAKTKFVISLAAGVKLKEVNSYIGSFGEATIVRIMTNIAMEVGHSFNVVYSEQNDKKDFIDSIFQPSGRMLWVNSEEFIDILTPISGSGPAYFFLLAEILKELAIKFGLEKNDAMELAKQTFIGSAQIAFKHNNFEELINKVASKGGVTEFALSTIRPILQETFSKSISSTISKIKQLSST